MEYQEYKVLYNRLQTYRDIDRLISEGYDERLIKTLFTQKISRYVRRNFRAVSGNSERILKEWKRGRSMTELAEKWHFPPVMIARFIFLTDGATRAEFMNYVRDPDLLRPEVAAELKEAIACDPVYSPKGTEEQAERGRWGEGLLQGWLKDQGIGFRTEADLRGVYGKTPDALLDEPMLYQGKKIFWVESKASFGDNTEFKYNSRKQLIPYTEIFGPGVVVYWVGKLDDLECPPDIYVEDISVLDQRLEKLPEDYEE